MADPKDTVRLTRQALQQLKDDGFAYVLVKGYSVHKNVDYMELNFFKLIPVKELPTDPAKMEIYAPLDSEILLEWADSQSGIDAFIEQSSDARPRSR